MLQGLPPDPYRLSEPKIIRLVVATVKLPQGNLDSAVVKLREGVRVLLQDANYISPVLPVKMIPEPVTSLRGPKEAGKGSWALRC